MRLCVCRGGCERDNIWKQDKYMLVYCSSIINHNQQSHISCVCVRMCKVMQLKTALLVSLERENPRRWIIHRIFSFRQFGWENSTIVRIIIYNYYIIIQLRKASGHHYRTKRHEYSTAAQQPGVCIKNKCVKMNKKQMSKCRT